MSVTREENIALLIMKYARPMSTKGDSENGKGNDLKYEKDGGSQGLATQALILSIYPMLYVGADKYLAILVKSYLTCGKATEWQDRSYLEVMTR